MGLGRFELPTSPLSGVRSNHLSYRPVLNAAPLLDKVDPRIPGPNKILIEADWTRAADDQHRQPEVLQTFQVENPKTRASNLPTPKGRTGELKMEWNGCHLLV